MKGLVSCEEAAALDAAVIGRWRLGPGILMETAANRLWSKIEDILQKDLAGPGLPRLVALAGRGNNGGDALALLRLARFAGRAEVEAVILPGRRGELLEAQCASLAGGGVPVHEWRTPGSLEALKRADFLVDGISGTGLRGPLRDEAADLARFANETGKPILAIDLPSGFRDEAADTDLTIEATYTLSIEPGKACIYAPSRRGGAGRVMAVEGVFPADVGPKAVAELIEPETFTPPRVSEQAHKGQRGRLAVFAGSPGMLGAATLAVRAAYAAGAGLVSLFVPGELHARLSTGSAVEALGGAIVRQEERFEEELGRCDAALAGPGWGGSEEHRRILGRLLETGLPLVLDADALRLLPETRPSSSRAPLLMTPHPGEFAAMTAVSATALLLAPWSFLPDFARKMRAAVILKASTSWLSDSEGRLEVLDGNEAGLAVAGSGDVLAGLAAGLLAGMSARAGESGIKDGMDALRTAALVHLLAGRRARSDLGWFEASSLIPFAAALLGKP